MDLKDIKAIIDLMKKNSVSEFELEKQDFKIRLKRGSNGSMAGPQADDSQVISYAPPAATLPLATPVVATQPPLAGAGTTEVEIKSPMIGTFYRSPSPESASYIEIGSAVNPDTIVCIIEAMKVMNEIKAEVKGTIIEVLIENAKPVEFGQALFKVRPS